jgi:hypothetical protein
MYGEHPLFKEPENPDIKIWRYVDLAAFVAMLNSQSLFFRRADKFEDKLEASLPIGRRKKIESTIQQRGM